MNDYHTGKDGSSPHLLLPPLLLLLLVPRCFPAVYSQPEIIWVFVIYSQVKFFSVIYVATNWCKQRF